LGLVFNMGAVLWHMSADLWHVFFGRMYVAGAAAAPDLSTYY